MACSKSRKIILSVIAVALIAATVLAIVFKNDILDLVYKSYKAAAPILSTYEKVDNNKTINGDFYVSTTGSDTNAGTKDSPFLTIEKAIQAVRDTSKEGKAGITVCIEAGEYCVPSISFTKADSGTKSCPVTYCAYNGEVVINGGKNLDPSIFIPVTDEAALSRLSDSAKQNVLCTNLSDIGLTIDDWGKLYPVGLYGTQANYDGDTEGPTPCNLYFNGTPLTTARYPNDGFLNTVEIIREGQGQESSTSNHAKMEGWEDLRNPQTTIFTVDDNTADRLNAYASLDNVWLWTALIYEWADTTVPLKSFDYKTKAVEPAYVSKYGAVPGSTYYIFNALEELDCAGEWYLDRESGMLYIYPPSYINEAKITMSLSTQDLITVTDAQYLCFDGLSVCGTRGNGMVINSSNITIKNCTISKLSGTGVKVDGYNNSVLNCELSHIGASAVELNGGDRQTLKAGNNRVENCLIHDFSEVSITEGQGVNIAGVGNICAHNELYNAPQQAILYSGNNNIIEYNNIHHVALLSTDSSAIYTGRRWDAVGTVVRYNAIYDIGSGDYTPHGIYLDDGASGQIIYSNIILNCKGNAFLIGGGRNNNVYNNILVNCSNAFLYDARSINAVTDPDFWFEHSREGLDMHQNLIASPWRSEAWKKAYPYIADWSLDYSDTQNPDFIPNPANSSITGNIIVYYKGELGDIEEPVYKYSSISNNMVYRYTQLKKLFVDAENGNYQLKDVEKIKEAVDNFENIPFNQIGIVD